MKFPSRRDMLCGSIAGLAAAAANSSAAQDPKHPAKDRPPVSLRQSVMGWCFQPMPMETFIPACARLGLKGVEGVDRKYYPLMKQHGLAVSLVSSHGFDRGPVDPDNRDYCRQALLEAIDVAVEWDCRNVITFTGMRKKGLGDAQAEKHCVELWKSVIGKAEEKNVTFVLEHLNSRDDSHPMKGHPGYFGDDVDHCVDMIRKVDSPNMKLLFDVYHVQIMNGDVTRRFRQYADRIGHVHTAGVPGRGELDENQELNYPAIARAIAETGYDGYLVQEFIPTWEDPIKALEHAIQTCRG